MAKRFLGADTSVQGRAAVVEKRLGNTTKGTAEKAKSGKIKIKKVKVGSGGGSLMLTKKIARKG